MQLNIHQDTEQTKEKILTLLFDSQIKLSDKLNSLHKIVRASPLIQNSSEKELYSNVSEAGYQEIINQVNIYLENPTDTDTPGIWTFQKKTKNTLQVKLNLESTYAILNIPKKTIISSFLFPDLISYTSRIVHTLRSFIVYRNLNHVLSANTSGLSAEEQHVSQKNLLKILTDSTNTLKQKLVTLKAILAKDPTQVVAVSGKPYTNAIKTLNSRFKRDKKNFNYSERLVEVNPKNSSEIKIIPDSKAKILMNTDILGECSYSDIFQYTTGILKRLTGLKDCFDHENQNDVQKESRAKKSFIEDSNSNKPPEAKRAKLQEIPDELNPTIPAPKWPLQKMSLQFIADLDTPVFSPLIFFKPTVIFHKSYSPERAQPEENVESETGTQIVFGRSK